MSWQATAWAAATRTGSPALKVVLLVLANYADDCGRCWPSQVRIAYESEVSERSVRRALKKLESLGLLSRLPRRNPAGEVVTTAYQLAMPAASLAGGVPAAKLAGGRNADQRPLRAASTGQALAGKPPVNRQRTTTSSERVWDAAADLEVELAGTTGVVRNRAALRRAILARYRQEGGPGPEVVAMLPRLEGGAQLNPDDVARGLALLPPALRAHVAARRSS